MSKPKKLTLAAIIILPIFFLLIVWDAQVQAQDNPYNPPKTTGTHVPKPREMQSFLLSSEKTEIQSVIAAYFEDRYQAFQTLKWQGFGDQVSPHPAAKDFRKAEREKLKLEIKHARINQLGYQWYDYSLVYEDISLDQSPDSATVSLIENKEIIYEFSKQLKPLNPPVTTTTGLAHTIKLRKEKGKWKIISDDYEDYLWRLLKRSGRKSAEMQQIIQALPDGSSEMVVQQSSSLCNLAANTTHHPYDRDGAVDYALSHAAKDDYNPDYPSYDDGDHGDCTNFVSQALFEGGGATMAIPDPLPHPAYRGGWDGICWMIPDGQLPGMTLVSCMNLSPPPTPG